jgi:hypothetical protein
MPTTAAAVAASVTGQHVAGGESSSRQFVNLFRLLAQAKVGRFSKSWKEPHGVGLAAHVKGNTTQHKSKKLRGN